MQQESTFKRIIKNPVVLFGVGLMVIIIVLGIVLALQPKKATKSQTDGDKASKTSGVFFAYNNVPALFLQNRVANKFVTDDIAYFARKKYKQYNPDVNPAIVFTFKELPKTTNGITIATGEFDLIKGEVKISVTELANDRVSTLISDGSNDTINNQLPSASAVNKFIARLPVVLNGATISYNRTTYLTEVDITSTAINKDGVSAYLTQQGYTATDLAQVKFFDDTGKKAQPLLD